MIQFGYIDTLWPSNAVPRDNGKMLDRVAALKAEGFAIAAQALMYSWHYWYGRG